MCRVVRIAHGQLSHLSNDCCGVVGLLKDTTRKECEHSMH